MEVKTFEVRDVGTFVAVLAIKLDAFGGTRACALLQRCGYNLAARNIILTRLDGHGRATNDPCDWGVARTMRVAHGYLYDNWPHLEDGQVICVEHILGERDKPKETELFR